MRAQRADIKIDALCMPLALFGHAVRATARGEQMRTVLGDVIVWRRCGARCAARVHTHTQGRGPDQPMAARRAEDEARVLIFERIHRELVLGCGRLPHESEPLAAARYAYNLAAPGARPGAYGSQMRGAWRTQGKRGTTRMLPPPPPSPPPSSQESSCRHSNSRTCTMQSQSRAASNIPTSPYRCRAPPPCLPPSPPRPRRPRRCRPRRCPRRRRRRVYKPETISQGKPTMHAENS